jgi:signal transduction histidine kinase/CheY-like chemotaxis protein
MFGEQRLNLVATMIVFFILTSLGPLLYLHNTWLEQIEDQSRVQDHLGNAREDLAQAHLWFEELLTGDPNVDPQLIWDLFGSARSALEHFQQEQQVVDARLLEFISSSGKPVHELLGKLSRHAIDLEVLARDRLGSSTDSSAGTAIDEEFDTIFRNTLAASFDVERAVREFGSERMAARLEIHQLTLLLWAAGSAGTGIGLIFLNRRRRRVEEEKKLLESQFQQAQKLESLGVLAGGIAHDFNNLLMEISGNTSLLLLEPDLKSEVRSAIEEIDSGAQKAAALTSQMLAYAGKGKFIETVIDFDSMIREMDSLLSFSVSKRVHVHYELSGEVNPVQCNPTQLQQVVMNLLINASEASDEMGGSIFVRSRREVIDSSFTTPPEAAKLKSPSPGQYIVLQIEDTGPGMSPEVIDRCFEPFFSTKFTGRGLGLSAVLGIVETHGGAIQLTTIVGVGTKFTIYLPLSEEEVVHELEIPKKSSDLRGQGRILVIDDDPTVIRIVHRMLTRMGYDVETRSSGEEGLVELGQDSADYDVVLVDMEMPDMNGEAVATEIRAKGYPVALVLSSGYTKDVLSTKDASVLFDAFIQKPYRVQELFETVTTVLNKQ